MDRIVSLERRRLTQESTNISHRHSGLLATFSSSLRPSLLYSSLKLNKTSDLYKIIDLEKEDLPNQMRVGKRYSVPEGRMAPLVGLLSVRDDRYLSDILLAYASDSREIYLLCNPRNTTHRSQMEPRMNQLQNILLGMGVARRIEIRNELEGLRRTDNTEPDSPSRKSG
jgi:hypothetical protein